MIDKSIVTRQLMSLQRMSLEELQEKFTELYGSTTASNNAQHLRRRLAYRIQEVYYGGLSRPEKQILLQIGNRDANARNGRRQADNWESVRGTRLERQWKGRLYEVIAMGDGTFEYDGRIFKSLSGVAFEITGTKWNGKLFFGVNSRRNVK